MKYVKTYELSKNINKHKGLYIDTVRNNHTSIFNALYGMSHQMEYMLILKT